MQRFRNYIVLSVIMLTIIAGISTPVMAQAPAESQSLQRFVVVMREGASSPASLAVELTGGHRERSIAIFETVLSGFAAEMTIAQAEALRHHPDVAYVEADFAFSMATDLPTGVERIGAGSNPTAAIDDRDTRVDVDIAILDTGIATHPDLNLAGGVNCLSGTCVVSGFDDAKGHGTHIAGVAAALDNGIGVVGVAPGARLWAVKVLGDDGNGSLSRVIAGLDWVVRQGTIEVVNMSLNCDCASSALADAVTRATNAGVVVVVSAGNNSRDSSGISPANLSNTIAVSAIADFDGQPGQLAAPNCTRGGTDDTFATFSNFGTVVDIAAPGVCINSTLPGGGYGLMSGTSMASPHVAGAAGLFIVERGLAPDSNRWSTVLKGLTQEWSVPQHDSCGFRDGRSGEPLLRLSQCEGHSSQSINIVPDSMPLPNSNPGSSDSIFFPETGHSLSFGFKQFWERSGGLPVFGYPLTDEFSDHGLTAQFFERQRFEYHPEHAGTAYEVELGRLGFELAERRGLVGSAAFHPQSGGSADGCQTFHETGFAVCGDFLRYWETHGLEFDDSAISYRESLALFGYPISEAYVDPATELTVQWFERARFEFHPTNPEPYRVLLGLLGHEVR